MSLYLLTVWLLHFRRKAPGALRNYAVPVTVALVLASSATPEPVLVTGVLLAALVAVGVGRDWAFLPADDPGTRP